ncbi:MAG: hypothetical protein H8E85_04325 [Candidatus Marinimicrobia bacterium]|nr:hypothetical protein [Candidatus Neomarinimicrobiota bacterium]
MLSIFTTPKDFSGEFNIIQKNALNSWRALSDEIEIIILGESLGIAEVAKSIHALHIKDVEKSPYGTPTISGLFQTAQKIAQNNILCYVNADIILPESVINVVHALQNVKGEFMAVGHRWDLDVKDSIPFMNNNLQSKFWYEAKKNAQKHPCTGIDYFIFNKGTFQNLPSLAIGRFGWDNWLLWKARRMRIPLIDVSDEIFAIHQNHSYTFNKFKGKSDILFGREGKNNQEMTKGNTLNILDCTHKFYGSEIIRKSDKASRIRSLHRLPMIFPELAIPIKIYRRIYAIFN